MSYEALRQFADSWGLLFMTLLWIGFALWLFRPGGAQRSEEAANMIFAEEEPQNREKDNG
ncbi:cbb3-type cytochrome c oxidase subunit 3 [Alterisphingorhabdus coralli]|uniref:Cbb3-type cytochrome c oxidase subunit 3 n=1 Tax=Alterisphingorhabdus coralli TaxID=3071408 RepID=A0AA97F8A5_9SPHN|nr:cbb3-type cytochrome c oxidase subunit 3 [Parasphingorhabdus sp. SCSIO 66989]WOE75336.1 cbb3-type cytochrome c oxidase subunit 3 [Parasphingorhabdus sp. SCSIO 66989]